MSTLGKKLPAKAADLVGRRFGRLVVLRRVENSPNGNARWACACDCGHETTSFGTDLNCGRTTSCGCGSHAKTKERHQRGRNLVGRRFGRLVVTAYAGLNSYPRATWRVECDCGATLTVTGHHLTDGTTVSCGCRASAPRPGALRDEITYASAHQRVKRLHGVASTHPCVDCLGQAEDWSYDHEDPEQRVDVQGRPYSMKPEHYWPRCRSCHQFFDRNATRAAGEVAQEGATA